MNQEYDVEVYQPRRFDDELVDKINLPFVPYPGLILDLSKVTKTIDMVKWDHKNNKFKVYFCVEQN